MFKKSNRGKQPQAPAGSAGTANVPGASDIEKSVPVKPAPTSLILDKSSDNDLAFTNMIYVSESDFGALNPKKAEKQRLFVQIWREGVRELSPLIYTAEKHRKVRDGRLWAFQYHRECLFPEAGAGAISAVGKKVGCKLVSLEDKNNDIGALESLSVQVELARPGQAKQPQIIDAEAFSVAFRLAFGGQIFRIGQSALFQHAGVNSTRPLMLKVTVESMRFVNLDHLASGEGKDAADDQDFMFGQVDGSATAVTPTTDEANLNVRGTVAGAPMAHRLIRPDFKFKQLGIGGLDDEFGVIFRRAFVSRLFPPAFVNKVGIKHVRGVLLYGPPGTGKTLIARQIGKMLNAHEPKIVSGPEVLNKFVGQSEENIRGLFKDAEEEYQEIGDDSQLHIVIFDEIDAICKSRGSRADGTGVGDSVVNQLLAKLDGYDILNNILVIGMTNRKDLIDAALLRPGRLEVQLEIGLPSEEGRYEILQIHTQRARENDFLGEDVDLYDLAKRAKNFSGAEIEGLVKSAVSYAMNRKVDLNNLEESVKMETMEDVIVTTDDFLNALDEVEPAYGLPAENLELRMPYGIIDYGGAFTEVMHGIKLGIEQLKSSPVGLFSMLLHGQPGTGKTALAIHAAKLSGFPFVRVFTAEDLIRTAQLDYQKIRVLVEEFEDAYKSSLSVLVLDDIERLIEYVDVGGNVRFSNGMLQGLLALLRKAPPPGRKLLVIGTTSAREGLAQLGMTRAFESRVEVLPLSHVDELAGVLGSPLVSKRMGFEQINETLRMSQAHALATAFRDSFDSSLMFVGIRFLLDVADRAVAMRNLEGTDEPVSGNTLLEALRSFKSSPMEEGY